MAHDVRDPGEIPAETKTGTGLLWLRLLAGLNQLHSEGQSEPKTTSEIQPSLLLFLNIGLIKSSKCAQVRARTRTHTQSAEL